MFSTSNPIWIQTEVLQHLFCLVYLIGWLWKSGHMVLFWFLLPCIIVPHGQTLVHGFKALCRSSLNAPSPRRQSSNSLSWLHNSTWCHTTGSSFKPLSWWDQIARPLRRCPERVWWRQAIGACTPRWGSQPARLHTTHLHHYAVASPPSSWGQSCASGHKSRLYHPRCFQCSQGKPDVPADVLGAWTHSVGLPCH